MGSPANSQPDANARQIAALFGYHDRQRRLFRQYATLGPADLRLLWLFADNQSRTLKQIADELGLEQSTTNRQVNSAMKEGLLERHRDGRGPYYFHPSPRGTAEFRSNAAPTVAAYHAALAALGPRQDLFVELMEEFMHAFGERTTP